MSRSELHQHINGNPDFLALRRRRSIFSWALTAIMLGTYYSFMLTVALKPNLIAMPLHADTVITWGIPLSLSIIALSLGLTGIFVVMSNREFDPATRAIVRAAEEARLKNISA